MARLPRIIVLVVLAFLVVLGAAHRKFRLAPAALRRFCAANVLRPRNLLLEPALRREHHRLPFKDAQLLLVRLLAL